MRASLKLTGVIPPLLTPFTEDGEMVDEEALRAHVEWLIGRGVHGLMPCGTTGEGPLLTVPERKRLLEVVHAVARGRVAVIAHVGAASTRETTELARHAGRCGVEAVAVVTPYYYRLPEAALVKHFCQVASSVPDLSLFLYNIPANTGNALSLSSVEQIVERCPNVMGIKDSSGDLDTLSGFVGLREGQFQVVCGSDRLVLRALAAGACACVSGNGNVFPEVVVELFRAFRDGDQQTASRQQARLDQLRQALQDGRSISLLKRVLELRGLAAGSVRSPLAEATSEEVIQARAALRSLQPLEA
jgi:4-hydroxy-tetrahydrodipicolinate synthase